MGVRQSADFTTVLSAIITNCNYKPSKVFLLKQTDLGGFGQILTP